MAVNQISLPDRGEVHPASLRALGTMGMIAGPLMLVQGILFLMVDNVKPNDTIVGVLGALYIVGWACSLLGVRRLGAAGRGTLSRILFALQICGLFLALLFSLQEIVHPNADTGTLFFRVTDTAWPASHVLMLVLAGFILKAKVWRGWRRFPPFLCGLALPAFFALGAIGAVTAGFVAFGILTAVGFTSLGYAVRASGPAARA